MMDESEKENMNKASGERDGATSVTQTVDGGMGVKDNKRWIEVGGEHDGGLSVSGLKNYPSPLPFFYFYLLRNSITSSR